jgi:hypothetical protein
MECALLMDKVNDFQWKECLQDDETAQDVMDILLYALDRVIWRDSRARGLDELNEHTTWIIWLLLSCFKVRGTEFF